MFIKFWKYYFLRHFILYKRHWSQFSHHFLLGIIQAPQKNWWRKFWFLWMQLRKKPITFDYEYSNVLSKSNINFENEFQKQKTHIDIYCCKVKTCWTFSSVDYKVLIKFDHGYHIINSAKFVFNSKWKVPYRNNVASGSTCELQVSKFCKAGLFPILDDANFR